MRLGYRSLDALAGAHNKSGLTSGEHVYRGNEGERQ